MLTQKGKKVKPQEIPFKDRNLKLYSMFMTGHYTKSVLGRIFKLSRERVNQIIKWADKYVDPSYPPAMEDKNN